MAPSVRYQILRIVLITEHGLSVTSIILVEIANFEAKINIVFGFGPNSLG